MIVHEVAWMTRVRAGQSRSGDLSIRLQESATGAHCGPGAVHIGRARSREHGGVGGLSQCVSSEGEDGFAISMSQTEALLTY